MTEQEMRTKVGDEWVRALLRAGKEEQPSEASLREAERRLLGIAPKAALAAALLAGLSRLLRGKVTRLLWGWSAVPLLAVAGAVGVAASLSKSHEPGPTQARPVAHAASLPGPTSAPQLAASSAPSDAASAARPAEPSRAARPASAPAAGDPSLRDRQDVGKEVALLDRVRAREAAGDPGGALRALDEHDRRFPSGVLAEEAELLRIDALRARGDDARAGELARAFLAKRPASVHRDAVRAVLSDLAK